MKLSLGFCASSEQFSPPDLVKQAIWAQEAGFSEILVSDHLQPWTPQQGQSSFVWSLLGAIGQACTLPFCTGVTAPGARFHPAIIAQAAATLACLYPQRFSLGLGVGEALNEHALGQYWPEPQERARRLLEALEIIERLLKGEKFRFQGQFFKMETLQLYSLPAVQVPIFLATSGPWLASRTGQLGFGLLTTGAETEKLRQLMQKYLQALPNEKVGQLKLQLHISWHPDLTQAQENAVKYWPNGAMNFPKGDIRYPEVIAEMANMVEVKHFGRRLIISRDGQEILEALRLAQNLGFSQVYLHQCGPNTQDFMNFCRQELFPEAKLQSII